MKQLQTRLALGFSALAAFCMTAAGSASDLAQFRTPSGNIGCGYYASTLRCDVVGGLQPPPPRTERCELDWGGGYYLKQHGKADIVCAGDTALDRSAPIVRYGSTWRRGAIICNSSPNGLRCTNADHHGFLISKGEAYRF
ncbi:MAG TPA: DUF6636 domain-containing protein [Candidatus Elarobacter sp.]|jgi:hypothetical protein|nr:DUF6636 domain-containing protein [Candidatus Elarobacter sp.]